jgi:hypothetical protein
VSERLPRAAVFAGIATALLLALRAPIDVGPRDAGELGAAAAVLGVSHPTGTPFAMVIAHAVTFLPIGTVAFRQSLAMAACMGIAVACAVTLALRRARGPAAAAVAIVVAAIVLAPTQLRAGTMMEVYAPSLMLVSAAWLCRERGWLLALGALSGLSLSAHVTARALVPLIALTALVPPTVARRSLRPWLAPVVAGLALAPLILEVPFAALRSSALAWGDPRTPGPFFRHFFASDLRASFATRTTAAHVVDDARELFTVTVRDAGAPLLALALAGALVAVVAAVRERRGTLATVLGCTLLDLVYSLLVNPMGIVDRQVGHAALLGLALLAGAAVDALAGARGGSRGVARTTAALACAAAVVLGLAPRLASELSGSEARFVAETWTVPGALARVPPRALVICGTDDLCGGALYAQLVEGARPDVEVVPSTFVGNPTYLARRLAGFPEALRDALAHGSRALLVDAGSDEPLPYATQTDDAAPLVRARLRDVPPPSARVASRMLQLDRALCGEALADCTPLTHGLLAQAHLGALRPLIASGRLDEAVALAWAATTLDVGQAAAWNDLAVAHAGQGKLAEAVADLDRALDADPRREIPLRNRVLYLMQLDRLAEARRAQQRYAETCAGCLGARIYGAALDAREGRGNGPLDALGPEAEQHGKADAWCRGYVVARLTPPPACSKPR